MSLTVTDTPTIFTQWPSGNVLKHSGVSVSNISLELPAQTLTFCCLKYTWSRKQNSMKQYRNRLWILVLKAWGVCSSPAKKLKQQQMISLFGLEPPSLSSVPWNLRLGLEPSLSPTFSKWSPHLGQNLKLLCILRNGDRGQQCYLCWMKFITKVTKNLCDSLLFIHANIKSVYKCESIIKWQGRRRWVGETHPQTSESYQKLPQQP